MQAPPTRTKAVSVWPLEHGDTTQVRQSPKPWLGWLPHPLKANSELRPDKDLIGSESSKDFEAKFLLIWSWFKTTSWPSRRVRQRGRGTGGEGGHCRREEADVSRPTGANLPPLAFASACCLAGLLGRRGPSPRRSHHCRQAPTRRLALLPPQRRTRSRTPHPRAGICHPDPGISSSWNAEWQLVYSKFIILLSLKQTHQSFTFPWVSHAVAGPSRW